MYFLSRKGSRELSLTSQPHSPSDTAPLGISGQCPSPPASVPLVIPVVVSTVVGRGGQENGILEKVGEESVN